MAIQYLTHRFPSTKPTKRGAEPINMTITLYGNELYAEMEEWHNYIDKSDSVTAITHNASRFIREVSIERYSVDYQSASFTFLSNNRVEASIVIGRGKEALTYNVEFVMQYSEPKAKRTTKVTAFDLVR